MTFMIALMLSVFVAGITTAITMIGAKRFGSPLIAGAASAFVWTFVNWFFLWKFQWVMGLSSMSFYRSFWLIFFEFVITAIVVGIFAGDFGDYNSEATRGSYVIAVACVLFLVFGLVQAGGMIWTDSRAKELAHQIKVSKADPNDYPPTSTDHMVIVPEQVARKAASVAMSSGDSNLGTRYDALDPVLQSVDGHAYWIVALKPSSWRNSQKVGGIVPAYIAVDAEDPNQAAKVIGKDATGKKLRIRFSKDGSFGHNVNRYVWSSGYNDEKVTDWTMEVDDQWRPYWTASVDRLTLNFNPTVPKALLTVDAQSGAIRQYDLSKMPAWVDRIYSAGTAKQLLNWWGDYDQSSYGFLGMFRGNANRFKVDGTPTLVYTDEGYPVWQVELSSRNNDSSVAYLALLNGRDRSVRLYKIPELALESTVIKAVQGSSSNLRKLAPTHLALHKIYGKLTWVAPLVPNDDKDSTASAIMQGVVLIPAESQLNGGDIIIGQTMAEALSDYQSYLASSSTDKPSADAKQQSVTDVVDRVSASTVVSGKTTFFFTLKGDASHSYRVSYDPMSPGSLQEVPFIAQGVKVTVTYADLGSTVRPVIAYDDLSLSLGNG